MFYDASCVLLALWELYGKNGMQRKLAPLEKCITEILTRNCSAAFCGECEWKKQNVYTYEDLAQDFFNSYSTIFEKLSYNYCRMSFDGDTM